MIKRLIGRIAVLFTVVTSVVVTTQATAMADFSWCPDGKLCFSTGVNGNGTKWSYWVTSMRGGVEMSSNQRSQISSYWNRTGGSAIFWDNLTCNGGPFYTGFAGGPLSASNLADITYGSPYGGLTWDNRARSLGHSQNMPIAAARCEHVNG